MQHRVFTFIGGLLFGLIVMTPEGSVADSYFYNGSHCATGLWDEGTGFLLNNTTLWNNTTTNPLHYSCPAVAPSNYLGPDHWDLYVYVHDGNSTYDIHARPFRCWASGSSCTWWAEKSSGPGDVTMSWQSMSTSNGVFEGFWVNLPRVDGTTGEWSGVYGYSINNY